MTSDDEESKTDLCSIISAEAICEKRCTLSSDPSSAKLTAKNLISQKIASNNNMSRKRIMT